MMIKEDREVLEQHREARKHQTDEFQVVNRQEIEKLASHTGTIAVASAQVAHEEALRKTGSFPAIRRAA